MKMKRGGGRGGGRKSANEAASTLRGCPDTRGGKPAGACQHPSSAIRAHRAPAPGLMHAWIERHRLFLIRLTTGTRGKWGASSPRLIESAPAGWRIRSPASPGASGSPGACGLDFGPIWLSRSFPSSADQSSAGVHCCGAWWWVGVSAAAAVLCGHHLVLLQGWLTGHQLSEGGTQIVMSLTQWAEDRGPADRKAVAKVIVAHLLAVAAAVSPEAEQSWAATRWASVNTIFNHCLDEILPVYGHDRDVVPRGLANTTTTLLDGAHRMGRFGFDYAAYYGGHPNPRSANKSVPNGSVTEWNVYVTDLSTSRSIPFGFNSLVVTQFRRVGGGKTSCNRAH